MPAAVGKLSMVKDVIKVVIRGVSNKLMMQISLRNRRWFCLVS